MHSTRKHLGINNIQEASHPFTKEIDDHNIASHRIVVARHFTFSIWSTSSALVRRNLRASSFCNLLMNILLHKRTIFLQRFYHVEASYISLLAENQYFNHYIITLPQIPKDFVQNKKMKILIFWRIILSMCLHSNDKNVQVI